MKILMNVSLAALLGFAMMGCSNAGDTGRSSTEAGAQQAGGRSDPHGVHDNRVISNPGSSGGFSTGTPTTPSKPATETGAQQPGGGTDPHGIHDNRVISNPGSSGGFGTGTPTTVPTKPANDGTGAR